MDRYRHFCDERFHIEFHYHPLPSLPSPLQTFTTAETMLNARTMKKWLIDNVPRPAADVIRQHMIAVR